ncbi:MAG: hypothetical protein WB511_10255 [Nitrososphaeraceae archaeon]
MKQKIPLSALAVASGIGLMVAMVAAAIQIPQTAFALECFTYPKANPTGTDKYTQSCGKDLAECNSMRQAKIDSGVQDVAECAQD